MSPDSINPRMEIGFAVRLMQHLVVPTFVLGPDGRVLIWNKACERLTNIKADEILGTKDHWKAFYTEPRDCLADVLVKGETELLDQLYATHSVQKDLYEGLRAENWCVMPKVPGRLYLAINAGPIFDDNGDLIAVVETLRDMTEQKRAEEALQSLAHKDGLTGLANRRSFDIKLESDFLHAHRKGNNLSLLLCDVDHFKSYNDTYGHQKGDECLKSVAHAIDEEVMRPTDLAARYGGEEFAVILPGVDAEGARRVAERINAAISQKHLAHKASEVSDHVTISVGICSVIPNDTMTPCDLIEGADRALYQAKNLGRNRVHAFHPS